MAERIIESIKMHPSVGIRVRQRIRVEETYRLLIRPKRLALRVKTGEGLMSFAEPAHVFATSPQRTFRVMLLELRPERASSGLLSFFYCREVMTSGSSANRCSPDSFREPPEEEEGFT